MATEHLTTTIVRNDDAGRFELFLNGGLAAIAEFCTEGDVAVFPHTEVTTALRGRGLGAQIVAAALDDARARGLGVVPRCWYVAEYIRDHPEYEDLVVRR